MWQQPLTIVSAHVDFQLSATRQPPLTPLPPSLNPWELGGAKNRAGSSLQQGADSACNPSPSSTPSDSETDWLLPWAGHLWPAVQCAPYKRRQVKSGYVSPLMGTHTQRIPIHFLLEKGRDSRVVVWSRQAQAQWKTIGYNGMCLGNKGFVHMLSLHLGFSFQSLSLSLASSTSQQFFLLTCKTHKHSTTILEVSVKTLCHFLFAETTWKRKM